MDKDRAGFSFSTIEFVLLNGAAAAIRALQPDDALVNLKSSAISRAAGTWRDWSGSHPSLKRDYRPCRHPAPTIPLISFAYRKSFEAFDRSLTPAARPSRASTSVLPQDCRCDRRESSDGQ